MPEKVTKKPQIAGKLIQIAAVSPYVYRMLSIALKIPAICKENGSVSWQFACWQRPLYVIIYSLGRLSSDKQFDTDERVIHHGPISSF